MSVILVIIASTVLIFINALGWLILIRAILQLFISDESRAYEFCYAVTEPVVSPVRNALSQVEALDGLPLEYVATYIILILVNVVLPPVSSLVA